MKHDRKFKELERRSRAYTLCSIGCNVAGYLADQHEMCKLSNYCTAGGCVLSVASMINYLRSIEKYEIDDESNFYVGHMYNMVLVPIVDTISLAYFLSSKEKKKKVADKINKSSGW